MPDEPNNRQVQALASVILGVIDSVNPSRGVTLGALSYCRNQLKNRTIVETAVLVAGCTTSSFLWNENLELYYDITKNCDDVAFISKGWDDPGFRLGDFVIVSGKGLDRLDEVRRFCTTNGIVMSFQENEESDCEVLLEQVIYSTGFDGRTFAQALSTLMKCSDKLKHH